MVKRVPQPPETEEAKEERLWRDRFRAEQPFVPTKANTVAITEDEIAKLPQEMQDYMHATALAEMDARDAEENAEYRAYKANRLARTDQLTGLGSRLALDEKMRALITELAKPEPKRGKRKKQTAVSIVFVDACDFGLINKTFGNEVGDLAIEAIGQFFRDKLRKTDLVTKQNDEVGELDADGYRKGGDENIIVMQCGEKDAKRKVGSLKEEFAREVTEKFLTNARELLGDEFDEKYRAYQEAVSHKYNENPHLLDKPVELTFSFGVKELSKRELLGLDTGNSRAVGAKIVQIMSGADDAQRGDKEAYRDRMRHFGMEQSKQHPRVSTKASDITLQ